jgi:hypothetical protein
MSALRVFAVTSIVLGRAERIFLLLAASSLLWNTAVMEQACELCVTNQARPAVQFCSLSVLVLVPWLTVSSFSDAIVDMSSN